MNDDKTRVEHMIEHCQRILTMLQDITEEQFYNSQTQIEAVSFNFAVLGEAASRISAELRDGCPSIPWRTIIAMRNFLIHEYIKIKPRFLWETAQNDLPPLLENLEIIQKSMESSGEKNNVPT
ncbi:MAG: DUF86 domain-containing protein [Victivallales bacterium]|nr:DUF86 domain-containing protein [Victivallales bacterium]